VPQAPAGNAPSGCAPFTLHGEPDLADKPNRNAKVSGANQTRVSENRLLIRDRPGRSGLEPTLTCVDDDIALIVIWVDTGHDD